jgi:hypothetical protein
MLLQLQDHGTSLWQLGRYATTLAGLFVRSGAGLRRGPVFMGSSPLYAGQALSLRTLPPIRPSVRSDDSAHIERADAVLAHVAERHRRARLRSWSCAHDGRIS